MKVGDVCEVKIQELPRLPVGSILRIIEQDVYKGKKEAGCDVISVPDDDAKNIHLGKTVWLWEENLSLVSKQAQQKSYLDII